MSEYLSSSQVAKMLGVTVFYVRSHAKEMRAVDLGTKHKSCLRFKREDVEEWLRRRMI